MPLCFKRLPTEELRQKALDYCRKVRAPILVGRLALEVGWWLSIEDTETLLDEFVREGLVRKLTPEELRQFDIRFGYTLV